MPKIRLQVSGIDSPRRADVYLAEQRVLPSRSQVKGLFEQGRVLINGKPARASAKVREGDQVEVEVPEPEPAGVPPEPIPLVIIYEDEDLVVVDKPAGLLSHPTPSRKTGTLVNALLHHCKNLSRVGGVLRPGIVHRLDKLTSGVMVAAKNDQAHHALSEQFKAHTIDRRYLAVVYGEMEELSGTIESVIGRNPRHRLKMTGKTGSGKLAKTEYRVLARNHGFSLLELRLHTGRTHQIRVHLSEMNHPVARDALYGKGRNPPHKLTPEQHAALKHLKRQALHAYRLGFRHPRTSEFMAFESPLPPDIKALVSALDLMHGLSLPEKPTRVQ